MADQGRCLHQFRYSNFNEKARWALAFKGIDVPRKSYLPGPHARTIKKIASESFTPVLEWDGAIVQGSAEIIDFLERTHPTPALYPDDVADREHALAIQSRFDAEVGGEVRRALFLDTMGDAAYMARLFAEDRSWLARKAYGAMLPLVRPIMRSAMELSDDRQEAALEATEKALDFVAREAKETGYLVGAQFSVADLTCAALLAVTANPDHPDMKRPEPVSKTTQAWLKRWVGHPGVDWVRDIYAKHRPA